MIGKEVFDSEDVDEYGVVVDDGAASYEDNESGLGEALVITGVTEAGIKIWERCIRMLKMLLFCLKCCNSLSFSHRDFKKKISHRIIYSIK